MLEIKKYLKTSEEVLKEYRRESLGYNSVSMKVLALFIFVVELFNIFRVIFLSNSGLSTLNNRIYFYMYTTLLLSAFIFLLLEKIFFNHEKFRRTIYGLAAYLWVMWHVLLNCYEIYFKDGSNILLFCISIYAFATCAQIRARYSLSMLVSYYIIFLLCVGNVLGSGNLINATICVCFAGAMSVRSYMACIHSVKQHLEIKRGNQELDKSRRELEFSLDKYHTVMKYTNDFIFELDLCTNQMHFSDNTKIKGVKNRTILSASEWISTQKFVHEEDRDGLMQALKDIRENKKVDDITLRVDLNESGVYVWYRLKVCLHLDKEQKPVMILGIFTNIDAEQRVLEDLEKQVKIDPMTELLNPVAFRESYYRIIKQASDANYVVMLLVDLDDFKNINDFHGHYSGDMVLKEISRIMKSIFRTTDYIARVGGDEFAIMMTNVSDLRIVNVKAEQLISAVEEVSVGKNEIKTSCSVGIMVTGDTMMPYKHMFNHADSALYEAKRKGKGCYYNAFNG